VGAISARIRQRWLVWALISFFVLTQVIGGSVVIESAIERAEFGVGACSTIDQECRVQPDSSISLGEAPSSYLNLTVHLSGVLPSDALIAEFLGLSAALVPFLNPLQIRTFVTRIFHPPKT
ncbi:MAG TPA: hypothetical protein VI279_11085, partial [Rhodocyclaceae bacterium]